MLFLRHAILQICGGFLHFLSLTIRPMLWSWHLRLYISTKIITPLIYYYIYGVGRHVFIGSSCIYDMHVGAGVFTVIKPFKKVV